MMINEQAENLLKQLNEIQKQLVEIRKQRKVSHTFEDIHFYISGRSLCEKNNSSFVRGIIKTTFLKKDLIQFLTKKIEDTNTLLSYEKEKLDSNI